MAQPPFPPPLPYQGFLPPPLPKKTTQEKIFTRVLIVLAALLTLAVAQFIVMRTAGKLAVAEGVFYYLISINSFLVICIILALIVRSRIPRLRRAATIAVSIVLLLSFPIGTVVGIYGLWKVDRAART